MNKYTFAVDPPWVNALVGEIDIVVIADSEKQAHKKAFESLDNFQQDALCSLDLVDVSEVPA